MLEGVQGPCFARRYLLLISALFIGATASAQRTDSTKVIELREAIIHGAGRSGLRAMPDTVGAVIMSGKRAVILEPSKLTADLSLNQARQIFAKVPGIHVWENDGTGAQLGIATRGLSPNRSWEFNLRQDGRDISADVFGYPEAYYTPPMEAVQRINVVRGASALAYGPQFGGMVDLVLKQGAADRPLAVSIRQTVGSYGLFNTYSDVGGTKGKWNYFGFVHHRQADGWRDNGRYTTSTAHGALRYTVNKRLRLGLTYTHNNLEQQQPGGLTDAQFRTNPRQSQRARNWMLVPWNVAALSLDWRPDRRTVVEAKVFGLLAERNSVGFVKPIVVPDTVSRTSAAYAPRQVDRDGYMNLGSEVRLRSSWSWLGGDHELSMGLRAYKAANRRQQLGVGTVASDADLTVNGAFGRELDLFTCNAAFHVENLFRVTKRFSVLPGVRLEHITNRVSGSINTSGSGAVNSGERTRTIPLFGLGVQVNATETTVLYGNITEAFRPVLFGDLTPSGTTDIIDPDLRDASGYNADLGYRGRIGDRFSFDAGIFLMQYDDRIGTRVLDGVVQRTNIGASTSRGLELFLEGEVLAPSDDQITRRLIVFASYAYTDARYTRWNDPLIAEDPTKRIADNRVENAPEHVLRMGLEAALGRWSASLQISAVDGVFTDAANTRDPNPAATVGWLPGYILVDATVGVKLSDAVALKAGVNNALDLVYATRRAGGYPGPGLLPGMGRQMFVTLSVDI